MVQEAFPGVALVSIEATASFLGLAGKTLRNMIAGNRSPVGTAKVGGRRMIPTDCLVAALAGVLDKSGIYHVTRKPGSTIQDHFQSQTGSRPGRPRKSETLAAERAGVSVKELRTMAAESAADVAH